MQVLLQHKKAVEVKSQEMPSLFVYIVQYLFDMNEKKIIEGLKNNDKELFKWLVETYRTKVINLCHAYLHSIEEAEDIAQDVFIEVYDSIHKFRGDAGLGTWIYRISVNKALNRSKRNQRLSFFSRLSKQTGNNNQYVPIDHKATDDSQPDHILTLQENKRLLFKAIDKLPEKQKIAFLLNKYEELSYKEIADVMNKSVSAVESLLFRAKNNLREYLSKTFEL